MDEKDRASPHRNKTWNHLGLCQELTIRQGQVHAGERYQVGVAAPPEITLAAACDMDFQQSAIIRGIFKARELILGSDPDETLRPRGLPAWAKALGCDVLAEVPGREIVVGA